MNILLRFSLVHCFCLTCTKKKFMAQREKNDLKSCPFDDHDQKILKKQSIETIIQKTLSNYIKSDQNSFYLVWKRR